MLDKIREARLRWFKHVHRRHGEYIKHNMLNMELPGSRERGRPQRMFINEVMEDMQRVVVTEEDVGIG